MNGPILRYLNQRETDLGPADEAAWQDYEHWRLARDDDDVAWLLFDKADSRVNTLSVAVLEKLDEVLEALEKKPPKGLVIRSAKSAGFCLGADIGEFHKLETEAAVVEQLGRAHQIAQRLADLEMPTLAVIHGNCLGGGLEIALCCDYRLALADARLGLPEIQLGLHPGLGASARLTRLIDPVQAMTLMLTGKNLNAKRAKQAGLVDAVIEERHLRRAISAALAGELPQSHNGIKQQLLSTQAARHLEARQMRAKAAKKADPRHYPAPEALIKLWQEHGGDSKKMLQEEIRSFARLLLTETAQNLIRVFFLREKMKGLGDNDADPVRRVHVIGAGAMGGDIAAWCALKGMTVSLYDAQPRALADAVARAARLCDARHLDERETRAVLDRMTPDPDNVGVAKADLVIEAVPEKIDLKRQIYQDAEPRLKPGALLASNTSSIPLEELQESLAQPERFLGLHFFNPVAKMPLVEVVAPAGADAATLARGRAFVTAIDRLPAPVSSAPGFLVNRALMPYLLEAVTLIDEGVAPATIDKAAEDFGMPMGPVELADQVGLDICLDVAEMLADRLDSPMAPIPDCLRKKVEDEKLGRKSGEGFYPWNEGKADKGDAETPDEALGERLLMPLLNASMTCLREEVIDDADLLDAAMIFGTGFAPFRGGPLNYANKRGHDEVVKILSELARRHGERFNPDPGWKQA